MNENKFLDGVSTIDSDVVERFVSMDNQLQKKASKPKSKKAWLRIGAIAACFFLIVSAVIVVPMLRTEEPGTTDDPAAVLPPTRLGSSSIQACLEKKYTLNTAVSEADVVARIQVGDWIAEDTDIHATYYEATVLECFKGNIPNTFTLIQDGSSAGTLKGYPLFTSGNEMLVFLNVAIELDYDSPYWIIGAFTTILDVSYDNAGNRYYADRYGILGETVDVAVNYARQPSTFAEVYARSVEADPIVQDLRYSYPYVFAESDLIPLLEDQ